MDFWEALVKGLGISKEDILTIFYGSLLFLICYGLAIYFQ